MWIVIVAIVIVAFALGAVVMYAATEGKFDGTLRAMSARALEREFELRATIEKLSEEIAANKEEHYLTD